MSSDPRTAPQDAANPEFALELRSHAELVGTSLRAALEGLVLAISGSEPRPRHLIARTGIDKTLAGRIIKTVQADRALTAVLRSPAPAGLGIFVRAAQASGAPDEPIARVQESIESFERLLSRFPRGRAGLDAAISGWVPEARLRGERAARQAAFKAMSFLFGHQSEATLGCTMLRPSPDGNTLDVTFVSGHFGLRRLRLGEPLSLFGRRYFPQAGVGASTLNPKTLEGLSLEDASCMLEEFCTPRVPRLQVVKTKDQCLFVLPADEPGVNEPISVALAHAQVNSWRRYASPEQREEWLSMLIRCPTRVYINDTFIRDDVYQGVEPFVNTHIVGIAPPPARDRRPGFPLDEVHLDFEAGWIAGGLRDIGRGVIPRYPELITEVFRRMGEDPSRYRIHRLRMNYPVSGIGVTRWFTLPERPSGPT